MTVAPPRGERGLKFLYGEISDTSWFVAPPRGERGLKYRREILDRQPRQVAPPRGERGLKCSARGFAAWVLQVAPPRGERGLKCLRAIKIPFASGRSPSWGAWIEIDDSNLTRYGENVAPPRGERGLKSVWLWLIISSMPSSLPLVGSVD